MTRLLDRYAARCVNFVLVVPRIAVLAARSAARDAGNQLRSSAGISRGGAPWLVVIVALGLTAVASAQTPEWWRVTAIQQELGLTPGQARSLEAIFHATHRRRLALNERLDRAEADLTRAIARGDEPVAMGLIPRVEAARYERNKARTMMLMRMYRVLSLQQRRKLAALQSGNAYRKDGIPAPTR
jgi:Spy/CpxP family protein refolding chaperone